MIKKSQKKKIDKKNGKAKEIDNDFYEETEEFSDNDDDFTDDKSYSVDGFNDIYVDKDIDDNIDDDSKDDDNVVDLNSIDSRFLFDNNE